MLALRYAGPNQMKTVDLEQLVPGPETALIEILATGICGSDVHGYTGETGRRHPGQVMGHETVGRLLSVGPGEHALSIGQLVTINPLIACGECDACLRLEDQVCAGQQVIGVAPQLPGAFADQLLVPVRNVVPLQPSTPWWQGALVEPLAVGYHAARRAAIGPRDRVLVIGGGPIGQAAAIGARRLGAEHIIVSEPIASRREVLERLGFEASDPGLLPERIAEVLGGDADVVIDAVGVSRTVADALRYTRAQGRVVLVGMGTSQMEFEAYSVSVGERTVIGSYCYSMQDFKETADWLGGDRFEATLLVGAFHPLSDGPKIFGELAEGHPSAVNKILLVTKSGEAAGMPVVQGKKAS